MTEQMVTEVEAGGTVRYDEMGHPITSLATCGTCGRTWDDAIITSRTPVPSGRCPFEHEHEVPERSYRSVPMCPPEALGAAGYYLEREWGPGRMIGYVGPWRDSYDRSWYVFQCAAGDGSRWLIRADRYGNTGTFEPSLEAELGARFDVEVSAR